MSDEDREEIVSPMAPLAQEGPIFEDVHGKRRTEPARSMHFEEQVDVAQSPSELERDIQDVLNRHSAENPSGTPDFILAAYLQNCLYAFNQAVRARSDWRGESVELPALQRLREDNEREVPLVVYTDGRRNEIGTARVQVTPGEMYVTGQISGAVAQLFQDPGVSYSVENSSPLREPKDEPLPQTRPTSRFERYQQEGLSS